MHMALWASAGCALLLIPIGVAQGGDFDESLWQVRHLLLFPVRAVVIMRALDCTSDELKAIGRIVVGAALLKAVVGFWAFYVAGPALGVDLEYTTSHTDTLLFVPALAIVMAQLLEGRSPTAWLASLLWAPIVFWALVCNDRRVSYVSLFVGVAVMLVMSPSSPVKRVLGRTVAVLAPVLPFYVGAGWASNGKGFFFPVGVLK